MTAGKPRLCIVSPHQRGGGAEYQIECLINEIIRLDRHEISYLARHIDAHPQSDGYEIVKIGRGNRMPRLGYIMDAIPLSRALRRIAPDTLYQRVACGYTGICAWYARRHQVPLTWHVSSDADLTSGAISAGRNPLRTFLESRSVEYGIHHADHIVVQTQHQAELLQSHYGRKADLIIPNFHPEPREKVDKSGPISVLWIGNFKPLKQPEAFVRAAAALQELKGVRFTMVGAPATGSGDREWGRKLIAVIQATPNIEYLGLKTQHEVNELLARAHVYVNTSKFEGFANTFIQAWMRDVAVVSLHVNPDGVLDFEGVGIYAGSEDKLVAALKMLIESAVLRGEYATRARQYAARVHSMKNSQKLIELIDTGTMDKAAQDR